MACVLCTWAIFFADAEFTPSIIDNIKPFNYIEREVIIMKKMMVILLMVAMVFGINTKEIEAKSFYDYANTETVKITTGDFGTENVYAEIIITEDGGACKAIMEGVYDDGQTCQLSATIDYENEYGYLYECLESNGGEFYMEPFGK